MLQPHTMTGVAAVPADVPVQLLAGSPKDMLEEDTYLVLNSWEDFEYQVRAALNWLLNVKFESHCLLPVEHFEAADGALPDTGTDKQCVGNYCPLKFVYSKYHERALRSPQDLNAHMESDSFFMQIAIILSSIDGQGMWCVWRVSRLCPQSGWYLQVSCSSICRAGCTSGFIGIIQAIFLIKDPDALVQIARKDIESMIHSMLALRLAYKTPSSKLLEVETACHRFAIELLSF